MKAIQYTCEILSVDVDANHMMLMFRSEGRRDILVGAKLPTIDQTTEDVIKLAAPIQQWLDDETEVNIPEVGQVISLTYEPPAPPVDIPVPTTNTDALTEEEVLRIIDQLKAQ